MSRLDVPRVYALHVLALFQPGRGAPVHDADKNLAGDIGCWTDAQVKTLIDEGRRQIDRQNEDLERVRGRSQVTLTLGLALAGAAGSLHSTVSSAHSMALWVLWIIGLASVACATLGAAATAVVRADLEMIHAAVLSRYTGDIDRRLAIDYANIASTGEQQIATRLTNLWLAVALLLTGAIMTLGAWLWADASRSAAQQPSCPCVYTYKKNHHKEPDQGKWQRKHGQGDSKDRRDHWKHHQEHEKHVHIKVHCHEHGQHMHDRRHGQSQMIKPHENSENEMAHPKTIRQELPFTR